MAVLKENLLLSVLKIVAAVLPLRKCWNRCLHSLHSRDRAVVLLVEIVQLYPNCYKILELSASMASGRQATLVPDFEVV